MTETAPRAMTVSVGDVLPTLVKDVSATTIVLGAFATRDWRPMHHDHDFAVNRNGTRDIFMNTPNFAAWLERYVTDWTGPYGRLGRLKFQMRDSVFPGASMRISGRVEAVTHDDDCRWVEVSMALEQEQRVCVTATARVAIPDGESDNPWSRRDARWRP